MWVDPVRRFKDGVKRCAYSLGALGAVHRWRNARSLTVVLFHRVVSPESAAWRHADPTYTVSPAVFAGCLDLFQRHYNVVTLDQVLAATRHSDPLPPRALLITFDDGWHDNLSLALPLLRSRGLPAALFIAVDAVADPAAHWWQDVLSGICRESPEKIVTLWMAVGADAPEGIGPDSVLPLLIRYSSLDPDKRHDLLSQHLSAEIACAHRGDRQMLTPADLSVVQYSGVCIGSHGAAHVPLTMLADPGVDINRAKATLTAWEANGLQAISFPHGRYSDAVSAAAIAAGHELLFTTDRFLNPAPAGWLNRRLVGRVYITTEVATDATREFRPHRLASWLFLQPGRRTK